MLTVLLLTACLLSTEGTEITLDQCDVAITLGDPSALPGDVLTLGGGPFTVEYDTVVSVDGQPAQVIEVTRDDCTGCDQCREFAGCDECGPCSECEDSCSTCRQTVDFEVPQVAAGDASVVLVNHYATSNAVTLTVEGQQDTGAGDSGE